MFGLWQRLSGVFSIAIIALLIGMFTGIMMGLVFFSIALLWMVIHHTRHLLALERWLLISDHSSSSIPHGSGVWDNIFAHLARYVRTQTKNKQLIDLE